MTKPTTLDNIYSKPLNNIKSFVFNEDVARVFDDMIKRSVPGYSASLELIQIIAERYTQPHSTLYDLGCSLGTSSTMLRQGADGIEAHVLAIDNSSAMVSRCQSNLSQQESSISFEVLEDDINQVEVSNASVVVLNYTLQFIEPSQRQVLLQKVIDGMLPGAALFIAEKVYSDHKEIDELQISLHETFKKANGYSELEISQKRTAIENTLIPDTLDVHIKRLQNVGYKTVYPCLQYLNFVGILAVKT